MTGEVAIRGRKPSRIVFDRDYQNPSYWNEITPLIPGGGFSRFLSFYDDLVDNQLRRSLAKVRGFKLDVGCGEGRLLGWASVGVDFSQGMLGRAKKRGRELIRASISYLPFRDGVFDFAFSVDTFQHLSPASRREVVQEVKRVSRNGSIYWARVSFPGLPRFGRVSTPVVFLASFFVDRLTIGKVLRGRTSPDT